MGVVTATTEANLSAINESLLQLSATLGRMAARQDQMLVDWKKRTAALAPIATTTPKFVSGPVLEQQMTKPSSSLVFSAGQVVGAGGSHADAVFASAMPTSCSAEGLAHYTDSGHAAIVFLASGSTQIPAATSTLTRNNMLQYMGDAGVNTPTCCSTHALSWPRDVPGARARDVGTDMSAEVLTHVGGLPLFQELELGYVDEVLNDSPVTDVMWYEELANCVVTHIGRYSLFLEPCVESAGVVFSEPHQMECEDDVFTIVGGLSLFLELIVESADGISMASNVKDVMRNEEPADGSKYVDALSLSPYNRNTLEPGISPALQCHGFSPRSTIAKFEHLWYGSSRNPLSVPGDPTVPHLMLRDTSLSKVTYSAAHHWDPGVSTEILDVHSLGNLQL